MKAAGSWWLAEERLPASGHRGGRVLAACLLLVACTATAVGRSAEPATSVGTQAEAAALLRAALQAEVSGNPDVRRALLRAALQKDPTCALAHWSSAEVRHGERWVPVAEAQRQAAADTRLADYRRLRDQTPDTVAGRIALAVWCRDHGLPAESRAHWFQVLLSQPEHNEALQALGVQWYQGQWLTPAQLEQAKQAHVDLRSPSLSKTERQALDRWGSVVANWRRALKQEDASVREAIRKEVASAGNPRNIYVLATALINGSRQKSDPKGYRLVSLALVDALERCEDSWPVLQLAWLAVEHPTDEVRNAAADALRRRPKISYVPWLLSYLRAPVETNVVVSPCPAGGVLIQETVEQEGPTVVYRNVRSQYHSAGQPWLNIDPRTRRYETNIPQVAQKSWRYAERRAAATQSQNQQLNAAIADRNQRIQGAISRATGARTDADPFSCQRWWTRYFCNEYELELPDADQTAGRYRRSASPYADAPTLGETPVVEQQRVYGVLPCVIVNSCFPWNTEVWTLTGAVKIAHVKPGDRVLSQHPFTGELTYRPVLQVTRRQPSPLIEIGLGGETIRATRGHPFWVCGQGWKMAKQLTAGMWLHSTDGPVRVERVEQLPAARPWFEQPGAEPGEELSYNLILCDSHNYFVGQPKILAHDNTLFALEGPMPAVPGLATP